MFVLVSFDIFWKFDFTEKNLEKNMLYKVYAIMLGHVQKDIHKGRSKNDLKKTEKLCKSKAFAIICCIIYNIVRYKP